MHITLSKHFSPFVPNPYAPPIFPKSQRTNRHVPGDKWGHVWDMSLGRVICPKKMPPKKVKGTGTNATKQVKLF